MTQRLALVRTTGNEFLVASEAANLSMVERRLGRLDEAETLAREALVIGDRIGDQFTRPFALAGLAAHGAGALRRADAAETREALALRYGVALTGAAAVLLFFLWRSNEVRAIQWLPHARVAVLWAAAAFASVAVGLVSLFARGGWPRLLLLAGLALELGGAAREMEYNQPGDPGLYRQRPAIAGYLAAGAGPAGSAAAVGPGGADRVLSIAVEERLDPARLRQAVPEGDGAYRRYASMREALKPGLGLAYELPTIDGYDGGLLPTRDYARFKSVLVRDEPPVAHFTLPPQLNGKVERSHRTDQTEFYQLLTYTDDVDLNAKLKAWENFYNYDRPHLSLAGKTPYEVMKSLLQ